MADILGELCERKPQTGIPSCRQYSIDDRKSYNRLARIRQRHKGLSHRSAGTALTCALVPVDPCKGSKGQQTSKIVAEAGPAGATISAKWTHDSTRSVCPGQRGATLPGHPSASDLASSKPAADGA
jgi:hypothetical protein